MEEEFEKKPENISTVNEFYEVFASQLYISCGFTFEFGKQKGTSAFSELMVWKNFPTQQTLVCSGCYLIRVDEDVINSHFTPLSNGYKLSVLNHDFFTSDLIENGLTQYMAAKDFLKILLDKKLKVVKSNTL